MQNTNNNTQTLCVELSSEQFFKLQEITNDLVDKFTPDNLKIGIFHFLTGWIGDDNLENLSSKERQDIFKFFIEITSHYEFCHSLYVKRENLAYGVESFYFIFELGLKKAKKYFKETMKAFLFSTLANDKPLRSDVLYYLEVIEDYVKKVQLIKTQNH